MTKYKQYFRRMIEENVGAFQEFKNLHARYREDKYSVQDEYNEKGLVIRKLIEDWDRRLCQHMEAGKNSAYSQRLSEKFWDEVRGVFPLIDMVGVTVKKVK